MRHPLRLPERPRRPARVALHMLQVLLIAALLLPTPAQAQAPQPDTGGGTIYLPAITNASTPARITISSHTPAPTSVTLVGSLQDELGCGGDWDPACTQSQLAFDATDEVWQQTFNLPAGNFEYKVALNGTWDENYGQNAQPGGSNIPLNLGAAAAVKFYYDHETHWVADNVNKTIVTVPGSFQAAIGCTGDWQPDCLRSWLQDPDGDGIYTRTIANVPAGNYEAKAAINESWDVNFGQGGVQGGPNLAFTVARTGDVAFSFDSSSHILTITPPPAGDVDLAGLGHNSRDDLYRVPGGAVTPGTPLTLRFRTLAGDATAVRVRVWDTTVGAQFFLTMQPAAANVSCFDAALASQTCDFWEARYTPPQPTVLYYRFIVSDGAVTAYYDDDAMRDGGWGQATTGVRDNGFVITVYAAGFQTLTWLQDAIIYQIFPDRFRNGRSDNDPKITEPRYGFPPEPLDQIINKPWSSLPEGYCRSYEGVTCPEAPRGRDYFGGDLRGVQQRLNYLQALGVTAIYFNPVFEAASNHAYDTQDYYKIDHFFGTNKEFQQFVAAAHRSGIRVILDGVFNHVSSDSPYFDRYGHFAAVGACESVSSPYRAWFTFHDDPNGPCVGSNGGKATYDAWFGFDSLPVLNKANQGVQDLVYGPNGVAQFWLKQGADAWRLDVMGDGSFPADFWPEFRTAVKSTNPSAAVIGELWKRDEVLPKALGNTADTTMNYRFRNSVMGYFGTIDNKGFPDDGQSFQPPSTFANKMLSVREDYPDAVYNTLMNLLDSHDTQRILWSLTPGPRNRDGREFNAANLAQGKAMLRLAALVQMTTPGAPTVYYGDEVGITGDDDPDTRRTMPWRDGGAGPWDATTAADADVAGGDVAAADVTAATSAAFADATVNEAGEIGVDHFGRDGGFWGNKGLQGVGGDQNLLAHYRWLTTLRAANPVLRRGTLSFLLTNDADGTLAYLMRTADSAALIAINRNDAARTLTIPLNGALPSSVRLADALGVVRSVQASNGVLTLNLPARSAALLLPYRHQDLTAPAAPASLAAQSGDRKVTLNWGGGRDAVQYVVYRSVVQGGGYVEIARTSATNYVDTGVTNGAPVYYVVRAVDAAGNLGPRSNEAAALPRYTIGWANLQWPPTLNQTISVVNRTETVYGQVWIDGVTNQPGATPTLRAQAGYGPDGSNPANNPAWVWVDATFNTDAGNNDEFKASFLPEQVGVYDYLYRYTTANGAEWLYADLNGPIAAGAQPPNPGSLTVVGSGDTTAPAAPANLRVTGGSPAGIDLAWDAVTGDATLYGYEVLRGATPGGPYTQIARVTGTTYTDSAVAEGQTYVYVVRALDQSFNRSGNSNEVSGTAALRLVTLVVNVSVPASTAGTGRAVNIAGTLNRLQGGLPEWNPGGAPMTDAGGNIWTITLQGYEGTQLEYKYALGSWDYVEKDAACAEVANRPLTLAWGANGTQTVNDTVVNWRNVTPCGN